MAAGALIPLSLEASSVVHFNKRYSPYRVLWIRVFVRAAFDYAQYKQARDIKLRKQSEDAARWLFDDSSLFNGFHNICDQLDLPIELLRKIARKMTKADVKKMEYLERDGLISRAIEGLTGHIPDGNSR
jgi:hypothetical protein